MNKLLPWLKANLISVIVVVLALIAAPVMLFFSLGWNKSIKDEVATDVSSTMNKLQGVNVTYEIPSVLPGQDPWEHRGAPNSELTGRVASVLERMSAESERVREISRERNSSGKTLLVPSGLFPRPANESDRVRLLTEFIRVWPEAHRALLEGARAGSPPSPAELVARLEAERARKVSAITAERVEQELTEEEELTIAGELAAARAQAYEGAAARISFYADPSVFRGGPAPGGAAGLPEIDTAWEWQWRYWVHQDIVAALSRANSGGRGGAWIPTPQAPVKRVLSIEVEPLESGRAARDDPFGGGGFGGGGGGGAAPMAGDTLSAIDPNYSISHTGRAGYPAAPNGLYDVRYVTLEVIADPNRIPELINAITSTNFMTVVGLEFDDADVRESRDRGFAFGPGEVVRATLRIETLWLRAWTKTDMPAGVRERLGIPPDPEPEAGVDGAQPEDG